MAEPSLAAWKPPLLLRLTVGAHAVAAATLALAPSTWPLVGGALIVNHALVCGAVVTPRSRWLGPNLSRLPPDRRHRVALTFDDGPDPRVTPAVLDLLDEYRARATFFCIGRRAEEHPELVAEAVARGHRVENHTYRHSKAFAFFGPRAQAFEVDRAQDVLESATGRRPSWFRAPAGFRNVWLDKILARRGLRLASWTRRGYDTFDHRPERVARRLLTGLSPGDVTLLHDGSAARDRNGRPVVLEVLPRLLDEIAAKGWDTAFLPSRP
ncbi:MAG: polysaccharide deacetylase family protein [Thermoanaerobaculia bacterium]